MFSDNQVVTTKDEIRTLVLIIYGLYLVSICTGGALGIAGIAGVILAYVKRGDVAPGSLWHTHIENQIASFWIGFILMIVGWATVWVVGLGFLILGIGLVYFLYRTLKGLVRALDNKPY